MGLYIYFSAVCAAFSGFCLGFDVGSLNGVKDMIGYRMTLNLSYSAGDSEGNESQSCNLQDDVETSTILGLIATLFSVGGVVGALCGGPVSDYIGRKPVLIIGGCLVAVGGLIHTATVHLGMVVVGRLLAGLGIGATYFVTPVFIGEIAPERHRGRLLSLVNTFVASGWAFGIFLNVFAQEAVYGWRIVLSVQSLGGFILALVMMFSPRSPRWLIKHGREVKAREVLHYIYKDPQEIDNTVQKIKEQTLNRKSLLDLIKFITQWKVFQRVLLGYSMILMGRLGGATFVGYFSVTIFCKIGLPGFTASLSFAIAGILAMIMSILFIDKLGRKTVFLVGLVVMFIGLISSALIILLFDLDNVNDPSGESVALGYVCLILMSLYMFSFNGTSSTIPIILMGELFPLPAKGIVTSICTSAFWIGIIISNQIGPILISTPLQISGTLFVFAANVFILFVIVLLGMPETKGVSLEDIEKLYLMPWKDRVKVLYYLKCSCFISSCKQLATRHVLNHASGNRYTCVKNTVLANIEDNEQMNLEEMNPGNVRHDASSDEEDNKSLNETNFDNDASRILV